METDEKTTGDETAKQRELRQTHNRSRSRIALVAETGAQQELRQTQNRS